MRRIWGIAAVAAAATVFAACGASQDNPADGPAQGGKIRIVTTIAQIAEPLSVIGVDKVSVQSLMGAGVDPHLYNATQGDIGKLENSDMIFYSGLHLEANMVRVFEEMGKKKPTLGIGETLPKDRLLKDGEGNTDPHIWFDLILRRMAMMADAISHTVLLGIVAAFLVTKELSGVHMLIGSIAAGLVTAVLVQWFHARGIQQEASIGIVFTTMFALGVVLIATRVGNAHLDVKHALMGEITFIPWETMELPVIGTFPEAVVMLSAVLLTVTAVIVLFFKEWKLTSFDPALAASLGLPVMVMHYVFMALVSVTTVASFDAVGAIMVVAMLITPASAAYLLTDRMSVMMLLSGAFGVVSAVAGYYLAVWLDTSISGSMAFATGILFFASFLLSPKYGYISKVIKPIQGKVKAAGG